MHATEPIWTPTDEDRATATLTRFMSWLREERGGEHEDYAGLWRWSVDALEDFWESVWQFYDISSPTPYSAVLNSRAMPGARWFEGARLNYAEQVLGRASPSEPALIIVDERRQPRQVSLDTLTGKVGALAEALRHMDIKPGDCVAGYMPNIEETVVALLAVSSLGAIWTVCSPELGSRSVIDRFGQAGPKALIAVDGYRFNGREYDRREVVDELRGKLPTVSSTILVDVLAPSDRADPARGLFSFEELTCTPVEPSYELVPFDHPLWILFSSGTTGPPKGIVQGHGGITVEHLKALGLCAGLSEGDRWLVNTSSGWMAWNLLVGGLLHGATCVLYDGSPGFPHPAGLWEVAATVSATALLCGSGYVSSSLKADTRLDRYAGLAALRLVIPTGSPLPVNGWSWLQRELPEHVRIDSFYGGTDVCTVLCGGNALLPVYAGEIAGRWLGVHAEVWDERGQPLEDQVGELVLTKPLPSMPLCFWNDTDGSRYRESYFDTYPGVWRQGDWTRIRPRGTIEVLGRSDSTLNRGGVRLGSSEVYTVAEGMSEIADSLVVGAEMPDGGYYMPLFVVPAEGRQLDDALRTKIATSLRRQLSPRHVPDEIVQAPAVPRTLTGKKLEIPVKRLLQGVRMERAASTGSVDRPDALEWFERFAARRLTKAGNDPPEQKAKRRPMSTASTKTITEQISDLQAKLEDRTPARVLARFKEERAGLDAAGAPAGIAEPGTPMPDGELLNPHGEPTSLTKARDGRAAVVVTYRGAWCPYCNLTLRAYERQLLSALDERGVALIALSPQKPDASLTMKEKNTLSYQVLSDPANQISGALGIVTSPTEGSRISKAELGIDLPASNADGTFNVPMPTTILVDREGTIRWIDVHPNYTTRTEPELILEAVRSLEE